MSEIEDEIRRQMLAERHSATATAEAPPAAQPASPKKQSTLDRWQSGGGPLGIIAAVVLLIVKFGAPLFKALPFLPKILITAGSMFASMWAYASLYGWKFGAMFVLSIFVHECGHAYAMWRCRIPINSMVFIPLMGALITGKRGKNVAEDAYIGIMGPVFGTLAGLVCVSLYHWWASPFWLVLGYWTLWINLFNLAPIVPLDGSRILPLISPKLLILGYVVLFLIAPRNPVIWILAVLSIPWVIVNWRANTKESPYYQVPVSERVKYGLAFAGLAAFLAVYSHLLFEELGLLRLVV